MSAGLDAWKFLLGKWEGIATDEFGEKGVVKTSMKVTLELGEKYLMSKSITENEGRFVHESIDLLSYDDKQKLFRRKSFYSYGFVYNEVSYKITRDEIRFNVVVEPNPKNFEGIRWRSYIRKITKNKVALGLELAQGDGKFKKFGESIFIKK